MIICVFRIGFHYRDSESHFGKFPKNKKFPNESRGVRGVWGVRRTKEFRKMFKLTNIIPIFHVLSALTFNSQFIP